MAALKTYRPRIGPFDRSPPYPEARFLGKDSFTTVKPGNASACDCVNRHVQPQERRLETPSHLCTGWIVCCCRLDARSCPRHLGRWRHLSVSHLFEMGGCLQKADRS